MKFLKQKSFFFVGFLHTDLPDDGLANKKDAETK